jgi:hypothetical protein
MPFHLSGSFLPRVLFTFLAALLLFCLPVWGQNAVVSGRVTDRSGALVPGASASAGQVAVTISRAAQSIQVAMSHLKRWSPEVALGTAALIAALASSTACRPASSTSLDRPAAEKLAEGLTVDEPWISIPAGLTASSLHNAKAIRAYRRLAAAGILRCNSNLTDCSAGPRGKHLTAEEEDTIRVIVGYLVVDDVTKVTPLSDFTARGDITLRFQPTFEYRQFRADFVALLEAGGEGSTISQADSDGLASAVFRRSGRGGWRVENIQLVKKTGVSAWRGGKQEPEENAEVIANLSPLAAVSVSSEDASTGQLGANAADGLFDETPGGSRRIWAARGERAGAWIRLTWKSPVEAWEVILYDRPDPAENILAGTLTFSDGSTMDVGELPEDGSPYRLEFGPKTITWVQFTVTSAVGPRVGLGEIEVYGTTE